MDDWVHNECTHQPHQPESWCTVDGKGRGLGLLQLMSYAWWTTNVKECSTEEVIPNMRNAPPSYLALLANVITSNKTSSQRLLVSRVWFDAIPLQFRPNGPLQVPTHSSIEARKFRPIHPSPIHFQFLLGRDVSFLDEFRFSEFMRFLELVSANCTLD